MHLIGITEVSIVAKERHRKHFTQPLYGLGHISFSDIPKQLELFGGEVFTQIVADPNKEKETPVYGLFYRDQEGDVWDVYQSSDWTLKVYNSAERLAAALAGLGLSSVSIPLGDKTCIAYGSLRNNK